MRYHVRFVHRISPRDTDVGDDIETDRRVTNAVRRNLARGGSTAIVGGARCIGWTRGGRCPVARLARHPDATTIGGREVCSPCHPGWFRAETDGDCCTMLLDLV